jgi:ubiquinone/menaquinone biosynthesis C-methylase UbiE
MGSGKHLGFLRDIGDFRFKLWLDGNADKFLSEVGVVEDMSVLDFGCGSGRYSIAAARLVGGRGRVYSLDVDGEALKRLSKAVADEKLMNVSTIISKGSSSLPLDDATLDHVLLIDVLQEISDVDGLLKEAMRVLKGDGTLTVFPMHLRADDVIKIASRAGFRLKGRMYDKRILLFAKA